MKVTCIRTCYDSSGERPYHEGETYKINDETHTRWKKDSILQHFADPDTGEPLMVVSPKSAILTLPDPFADVKAVAAKLLAEVEEKAAKILEGAQAAADKILADAVEATKDADPKDPKPPKNPKEVLTGSSEESAESS